MVKILFQLVFPTILTIPTIPAEIEGGGEGCSDSENSDRIPKDSKMLKILIQWDITLNSLEQTAESK